MTQPRKRWKRTGRARLPGVREAGTNRPQRETVEDIKGVVKTARKRHGVPDAWLDNPDVETQHGMMRLNREITQDQWQAAEWYLDCRYNYLQSIGAAWEGVDCERRPSSGSADPDAAHTRFCGCAKACWDGIEACLLEAQVQSRSPVKSAFHTILVLNQPSENEKGDLKLGLNALWRLKTRMMQNSA